MDCRPGCAACCIAPSISSPIPGMPHGKPAGVRCAQLDEAGLGLVLLCLGAGSLLAMPLTARFGCRRLLVAAVLLICATLPALAWAADPFALGAALFLFGAGVGGMDCTMNMQAVAVERDSGRAMIHMRMPVQPGRKLVTMSRIVLAGMTA